MGTSGFAKFWTTDSCPGSAKAVSGQRPFEVVSLADSIAAIVTEPI